MLAGLWAREEYRAASAAETTLAAIKRSKQNIGARCAAIAALGGGGFMAYAHSAGGGTRREGREALAGAETCAERRSPFQNIAEHPRTFLNNIPQWRLPKPILSLVSQWSSIGVSV